MSSFDVYLLFCVLPNLTGFLFIFGLIFGALTMMHASQNETAHLTKGEISCLVASFFIASLSFAVPSQKEMAIIYFAPKIVNNQSVQQLPDKIMRFIEKQIGVDESK